MMHPQDKFFFPPSCQIQNIKLETEEKPQKALALPLPSKYVALLKSCHCNRSAAQLAERCHLWPPAAVDQQHTRRLMLV